MENISVKTVMGRSTASVCMNLNMNLINDYEQRGKKCEKTEHEKRTGGGMNRVVQISLKLPRAHFLFNQGNKLFL